MNEYVKPVNNIINMLFMDIFMVQNIINMQNVQSQILSVRDFRGFFSLSVVQQKLSQ